MFTRYTKIRMPYYKIYDPYSNEEKVLNIDQYDDYKKEEVVMLTDNNGDVQIFTDEKQVRGYVQLHEQMGDTFHMMQDPMTGQAMPMAVKNRRVIT